MVLLRNVCMKKRTKCDLLKDPVTMIYGNWTSNEFKSPSVLFSIRNILCKRSFLWINHRAIKLDLNKYRHKILRAKVRSRSKKLLGLRENLIQYVVLLTRYLGFVVTWIDLNLKKLNLKNKKERDTCHISTAIVTSFHFVEVLNGVSSKQQQQPYYAILA